MGRSLLAQTGTAVPSLAAYDAFVTSLMSQYNIPGASLVLTLNGRLIMARGYGYTDALKTKPVQPDSMFRLASLSKFITALSIMKLVDQGKINLDAPAFALTPDLQPLAGATIDPRLKDITVRHLLNHSGGWDRGKTPGGYDPMFLSAKVVSTLGVPAPASTENIIRYMMGQPLDFTPGSAYVYSNFGYAVLGRIMERVTGQPYEMWVRSNILLPSGITEMRVGQTLSQGTTPGEVQYVSNGSASSVFPDVSSPTPWPYGGWYMEAMDSHGAWIASAIDYAKILNAVDGRRGQRLLSATAVATLTARPSIPQFQGTSSWYAMGAEVNTANNWWHSGSLDGTATYYIRTNDGYVYVLFLNSRDQGEDALFTDIDRGYWNARAQVTSWPTNDLFPNYPDADPKVAAVTPAIVGRDGVVNGATFDRGVVSGSWFTVFGSNLSSGTRLWSGGDIINSALPQSLDGVSVTVDGKPAFVYYISPTQINAQAPAGLTPGWKAVVVTRGGIASKIALTHVVNNAPGVLTYPLGGRKFAVATTPSYAVIGDPTLSSRLVACKPGDTILVYASALTSSPAGTAAPAQNPLSGVTATIGGRAAPVSFAGLISPGLYQMNVLVPALADGDAEVIITYAGTKSPPGVVVPIHN
jgi:N-acyl-D-amino-acid deacylase